MLKDREQKARALKYVVSKRWFPQIELDVSTHITVQSKPINITDVDVFGAIPAELGRYRYVLIDCKTGKNESPIGRALWLRGLMERMRAERAICILRTNNIQTDHRYSAAQLGITLLSEQDFDAFGRATSSQFTQSTGAVGDIAVWDLFFSIPERYRSLGPAIDFSRSAFWMSESDVEACTRTLYLSSNLRAELDPAKAEHLAVVADLSALLLHALARIVNTIFAGYLQPTDREQLSNALLLLLYGGRSSYMVRSRIKKMVTPASDAAGELSLPEWSRFVQLVRQALDAPYELLRAPLILREVGWSCLSPGESGSFLRTLCSESPQAARLAVLGIDYLCRASKFPPEFMSDLTQKLMDAQTPQQSEDLRRDGEHTTGAQPRDTHAKPTMQAQGEARSERTPELFDQENDEKPGAGREATGGSVDTPGQTKAADDVPEWAMRT
jgi:hypothetical protein